MYYLVKENMGNRRCIARKSIDDFVDGDEFDCLVIIPADIDKLTWVRTVSISCTNSPGRQITADIYTDDDYL